MPTLYSCILGPRLLRYQTLHGGQPRIKDYLPSTAERWSDTVLSSLSCAGSVALYASPIIIPVAIRRGWLTVEGGLLIAKFIAGLGLVIACSLLLRGVSRWRHPMYTTFMEVLTAAHRQYTPHTKKLLQEYDFQFSFWPRDFDVADVEGERRKPRLFLQNGAKRGLTTWPSDIMAYILTHTFGISLVFPGSMSFMAMLLERPLLDGRTKLIVEHGGERFKLRTRDKNEIDAMFVHQPNKRHGKTLVICCEGNAGFYEIGVMGTPLEAGYSVLGWNHPGFYGSTGVPLPGQDALAADAVMQFAIHRLGFKPEQILVMGWSIGGYSATWLAMNYPDIKGLILDATFDDLEPLALPRMPSFMSGVVQTAVRNYINLNIGEQLVKYKGPVRIIRRLRDEMISTSSDQLFSNRGNDLLVKLIGARFPRLSSPEAVSTLLAALSVPLASLSDGSQEVEAVLFSYLEANSSSFPCHLGGEMDEESRTVMLFYLSRKYMSDVDTTHCTPLPVSLFQLPWDPSTDVMFETIESDSSKL